MALFLPHYTRNIVPPWMKNRSLHQHNHVWRFSPKGHQALIKMFLFYPLNISYQLLTNQRMDTWRKIHKLPITIPHGRAIYAVKPGLRQIARRQFQPLSRCGSLWGVRGRKKENLNIAGPWKPWVPLDTPGRKTCLARGERKIITSAETMTASFTYIAASHWVTG